MALEPRTEKVLRADLIPGVVDRDRISTDLPVQIKRESLDLKLAHLLRHHQLFSISVYVVSLILRHVITLQLRTYRS